MSPVLVTGAAGQLGTAFRSVFDDSALFLGRRDLDVADHEAVFAVVQAVRPALVINCAAFTDVDKAETEPDAAAAVNTSAVAILAEACASVGARFVTFSTDYVFDGLKTGPYVETDIPHPINVYGRTKLEGERAALSVLPGSLVVRTSWLISPTHRNFVTTILGKAQQGSLRVVDDQRGRATVAEDLARAVMEAVDQKVAGVLHLTNPGELTWFDLARRVVVLAGLDALLVEPCRSEDLARPAPRPANSALASSRLVPLGLGGLPDLSTSLPGLVAAALRSSR